MNARKVFVYYAITVFKKLKEEAIKAKKKQKK